MSEVDVLRYALVIAGSLFAIGGVVPYLIEIVRGTTKPRVVTWAVWTTLTAIGFAAALADGQHLTAILLAGATLATLSVVVLGWHHGDKHFEKVDIVCLVGALVGIVLWQVFNSPAIAVIASIGLDLVGGIPTILHIWKKPGEETWTTFMFGFIGSTLTLLALTDWRITASAYPIYLVTTSLTYMTLILVRRKVLAGHH